jgi:hypothetical protein
MRRASFEPGSVRVPSGSTVVLERADLRAAPRTPRRARTRRAKNAARGDSPRPTGRMPRAKKRRPHAPGRDDIRAADSTPFVHCPCGIGAPQPEQLLCRHVIKVDTAAACALPSTLVQLSMHALLPAHAAAQAKKLAQPVVCAQVLSYCRQPSNAQTSHDADEYVKPSLSGPAQAWAAELGGVWQRVLG